MQLLLALLLSLGAVFSPPQATHHSDSYKITGTASHYACTAGWCDGTPTVALPLALGGRYTGRAHGVVTVCADRCAQIIVVDYCQCYWGTKNERIVDLNEAAWRLVTNKPLSAGLIQVTIINKDHHNIPDTRMEYHGNSK